MSDVFQPPPDPLIGARVGEYEIIEPIGEGGMGVVYRGIQPVIKKRVAIKVLKPSVAQDEHQVKRLITEAEAVNAIGHRGIVDIFSLATLPDGRPYVVMEYLDGEPLDLWLQKQPGGRVSLLTALELLLEVCAPLAAAHRANVIHRDLKPSNIFVCRETDGSRYLKLLDFGLAKRAAGLDGNTKQTSQSYVSGTPDYMAPEQARGLSVSPRSDLYSLGVIAFELFTGRVPFTGATAMDVMVAHVGSPPPSPRSYEPALPIQLEVLVLRMLAKAPEARPQSVDEVRAELEEAVVQLGAPRPRSSRELPALIPMQSQPRLPPMFTPIVEPLVPVVEPPPAPVFPSVDGELADPQPRSRTGLYVGVVVLLGLLGSGAAWTLTRPEKPQLTPPVAVVDPPVPVVVAVEDAGALDAGLDEDAGLAVEDAGVDAGVTVDAGTPEEPIDAKALRRAPTVKQLKDRLAKLEARSKKKKVDRVGLKKLRAEISVANTPLKRVRASRALDAWERENLPRR
ncbi:MAG: serine/threonine-protein kinase [Myxococcota bacterium]